MISKKQVTWSQVLCLGFLLAFFLLQYLLFGYVRVVDTTALENFSHDVYPLYPLALLVFRSIFGAETGYFLLGLAQNVLLALSIFVLTDYIRKAYGLSGFTFFGASAAVAAMFLVQKWATLTGVISSNTLFSEAFAIPFYLIFFRYALEAFISEKQKPYILSCIWAGILILTRGQFYWTLIIIFLNGIRVVNPDRKRAFICALLACAGVFAAVLGVRGLQTSWLHTDEQTRNPANLIVLTTAVYCSESDDYLLFDEGSGERRLLEAVRPTMDDPEKPVAFSYEKGDLIQRHKLFETRYDELKDCLKKAYYEISAEGVGVSLGEITKKLIFANPISFSLHCMQNFAVGLIRTVALLRPGLDIFALLLYLMMVLIAVTHRGPAFRPISQFLFFGMLCALLNTAVIAPGVFAQSRYVFYNMPVLYLGLGVYAVRGCRYVAERL